MKKGPDILAESDASVIRCLQGNGAGGPAGAGTTVTSWSEWFGNLAPVHKAVYAAVGLSSYPAFALFNSLQISGTAHLRRLPQQNVLFVCNHQTYFFDVMALLHIFGAVKWGQRDRLGLPFYLLNPFTRVRYVAADQTMKSSWISRFFTLAGGITVKRTWSAGAGEVRKGLDPSDTRKISRALARHWVINFPQGTTASFAPGRKGTALIIKQNNPIVIPVVIKGFSEAFEKRGLGLRKIGTRLSIEFKPAMAIDCSARLDAILAQVMSAIEQDPVRDPDPPASALSMLNRAGGLA